MNGSLVGIPGSSGLSVEQRKRLTIAVELVANPSIVFMDEPTSGAAARLCQLQGCKHSCLCVSLSLSLSLPLSLLVGVMRSVGSVSGEMRGLSLVRCVGSVSAAACKHGVLLSICLLLVRACAEIFVCRAGRACCCHRHARRAQHVSILLSF